MASGNGIGKARGSVDLLPGLRGSLSEPEVAAGDGASVRAVWDEGEDIAGAAFASTGVGFCDGRAFFRPAGKFRADPVL